MLWKNEHRASPERSAVKHHVNADGDPTFSLEICIVSSLEPALGPLFPPFLGKGEMVGAFAEAFISW
jgi:hypothetical protein